MLYKGIGIMATESIMLQHTINRHDDLDPAMSQLGPWFSSGDLDLIAQLPFEHMRDTRLYVLV